MFQPSSLIGVLIKYRYVALFPLAVIEGLLVALAVGFMVRLGYFSFIPAYGVMILGDFIPDSLYYLIGRYGNRTETIEKHLQKIKMLSRNVEFLRRMWETYPTKTMFFSKLAYGISTPLLISAGIVRMSYRKFVSRAFFITLLQYGIAMTIGYYLGASYALATNYVEYVGITIAALVILILIFYAIISKYARKAIRSGIVSDKEEKK